MRDIDVPYYLDDEDGEAKEAYLNGLGIDWSYLDHNPWHVLESVDSMIKKYGLEVVCLGDGEEFGIARVEM